MKLTVVIPIFNRSKMLSNALESLRWQTLKDFVVIVCDDASTEDLKTVVDKFPDLNIDYQRYEINVGQFKNVMRGVELCETPFIKILHSDDLLFPIALEMQVKSIQERIDAAICLGGSIEFEEIQDQNLINILKYHQPYVPQSRTNKQWAKLEYYEGYIPSACLYRTEFLRDIGGFNIGLNAIADWEIYLALSSKYSVVAVDEPICAYRLHANQVGKSLYLNADDLKTKDLLWMTSDANPYRERLGLPSNQIAYLIYDVFWQNLRLAMKSTQEKQILRKWLNVANSNRILLPFIFSFPWFAILRILRRPKLQINTLKSLNIEKYNDYIYSILSCEILSKKLLKN